MRTQNFNNNEKGLDILYISNFYKLSEAEKLYHTLSEELRNNLEQKQIKMFGKMINEPRLTAWFGEKGTVYTYSGITRKPIPWTPTLKMLQEKIADYGKFNSALVNLYRGNTDSISAHSDDEKELGTNPTIVSLSFGGTRRFILRNKMDKKDKIVFELHSGSMLVMRGETQTYWTHEVPKTKKTVEPRINITFRYIYSC